MKLLLLEENMHKLSTQNIWSSNSPKTIKYSHASGKTLELHSSDEEH